MLIAGCAISLFHLPQTMQGQARGWVDQRAVAAGFAVDHVAVIGHEKTSMSQIADVLDLDTEKSLLGFNGAEVRRKLKRLPWVESVQVVHILPDTVSIRITERLPFAIWQHNGKRFLIDRSGQTLAAHESPRQQEQYPLVVGKGAGVTAGAFLENVTRHPAISNRVRAAVRVADRRWNLVLKSGKKVLLPETGLRTALAMLEALFTDEAMQANSIAMIDLRVPARPTVRLAKSVSKTLRDSKTARRAAAILLAGGAS